MSTLETIKTGEILALSAEAAIKAKAAKKYAEEAYKTAEADAIDAFVAAGETTIMIDDTRVTVEGLSEVRRTIDVEALAELIPAKVLIEATKRVIDTEKFDAMVLAGLIPAEVAAKVTATKPVKPSLRITANAKK